jgi:hypothetical protein
MMDYKTIRQLEPIVLAEGEEIHLELIEFGGTRWLSLTTWTWDTFRWVKLPGSVKVPVTLLDEVQRRFVAAVTPSRAA